MSTVDPLTELPADALGISASAHAEIVRWLTEPTYADLAPALRALVTRARDGDAAAQTELSDAFAGPLPIGTGGRRGAVGPGTNRINTIVLRQTAQGLYEAMKAEGVPMRVAVAFDTRRDSRAFARVVAQHLASLDVEVLLIDEARPTPQLSLTVRARDCGAGIVISASHNPPGDNGIKIYGPDGAQVLGARDRALMAAIRRAMSAPLPEIDPAAAERITVLPLAEVDAAYHGFVRAQGVAPLESLRRSGLTVVFTPLHGVGHTAVVPGLADTGIEVILVERQCDPDGGNFSTVKSANPEAPDSMAMGAALADERGAALVIATDPDADRLGALARNRAGTLEFIDGNRLAVIMLDHVLRHATLPDNGFVLTTVVSSALIGVMARAAGVEVIDDLLVGFKHHAGMMAEHPEKTVVFGCEESHGFMRGDHVHDKDGSVAARLLVEAATIAHAQGKTLFDVLEAVWRRYGYHRERTENLYAYGLTGREAIAGLMARLREEPPTEFAGLRVTKVEDRAEPRDTGSATRDLPGNVLIYDLEGQRDDRRARCRLTIRPSGTEPKAKVYALAGSEGPLDEAGLRGALVALPDEELRDLLSDREWEALTMGYRERVGDTHLPHVAELPAVLPALFADAAERARAAGFDGVELHYAHAYTMASFLSARNDRKDGYGGSASARVRLPLEVFAEVRRRVGDGFTVGCRFLGEEVIDGGSSVDDATFYGVRFAAAGLDFLSVSKGGKFEDARQPAVGQAAYPYTGPSGHACMPTVFGDEPPFGLNLPLAAAVRAAVREAGHDTPVVASGGINGFALAERALAAGHADLVAAARQTLADPDWVAKVRAGHGERVNRCLYTNYCEALDQKHKEVTCQLWDRLATDAPGVALAADGRRRLVAPRGDWVPARSSHRVRRGRRRAIGVVARGPRDTRDLGVQSSCQVRRGKAAGLGQAEAWPLATLSIGRGPLTQPRRS